jgi:MOSC domain-containing protein YiiM
MPFNPGSSLAQLINTVVRPGEVLWIGLRPARRAPMQSLAEAEAVAGRGLVGDRYSSPEGARQVTLFQLESLHAIASHLGRASVEPEELRRNILVKGINLMALKGRQFRIGASVFEATGECHPCSRLETTLGVGGYNATRGLGGITARVILGGTIHIGDTVVPIIAGGDVAGRFSEQFPEDNSEATR